MTSPIVYISSSVADAAFAERLAEALERAAAIVTRGPAGSATAGLPPEAVRALNNADACVVLLSAEALASERIERAAAHFHELHAIQPQRLLVPVLLAGVEPTAVWPFLRDYTPLSAASTGARDDEALAAEVLRRLDLLLRVDTVVMPAIPAPGAVPAGLDLAKAPPPVVGGGVEAADTEALPAIGGGSAGNDSVASGTTTWPARPDDGPAWRWAAWVPNNRRRGILILVGGLLALVLCVALGLGLLARGGHPSSHSGAIAGSSSTNTAGQTPSLVPTAGPIDTVTATASPDPAATPETGAPQATASATAPAVTQPGLRGDYYTSTAAGSSTPIPTYPAQNQLVCSEVDPNIDYPTRKSFGCNALTNNSKQTSAYAVKWYGYITVPRSGSYTFFTYSDDGIGVIVNGQQLIYDWTIHSPAWDCSTNPSHTLGSTPAPTPNPSDCSTITLTAGQLYPIELDYYENGDGGATIQLCWQAPNLQSNIIPPSAFSH